MTIVAEARVYQHEMQENSYRAKRTNHAPPITKTHELSGWNRCMVFLTIEFISAYQGMAARFSRRVRQKLDPQCSFTQQRQRRLEESPSTCLDALCLYNSIRWQRTWRHNMYCIGVCQISEARAWQIIDSHICGGSFCQVFTLCECLKCQMREVKAVWSGRTWLSILHFGVDFLSRKRCNELDVGRYASNRTSTV